MSTALLVLLFIVAIGGLMADVRGTAVAVAFNLAWVCLAALLLAAALRTGGFL